MREFCVINVDIYALAMLAVTAWNLRRYASSSMVRQRHFMRLLLIAFSLLTFEIIASLGVLLPIPKAVVLLVTYFLCSMYPLLMYEWFQYIAAQLRVRYSDTYRQLIVFLCLTDLVFIAYSQFTGLAYYIDDYNVYHNGDGFVVLIFCPVVMLLVVEYMLLFHWRLFKREHVFTYMIFPLPMVVCVLGFHFFGQELFMVPAGVSFSLILICVAIRDSQTDTDFLTQVSTRSSLERYILRQIERSHRKGKTFGALMIDVNKFKYINDTYGHAEGDSALQDIATIMRSAVSGKGVIGRYGGDEFLIILNTDDEQEMQRIKRRIEGKLNAYNRQGKKKYQLGVSIGMDFYRPWDSQTVSEFKQQLDEKMYKEKRLNDVGV